jgi:hypothetical protein
MPGVLRWGYVSYWVADAGTEAGLGTDLRAQVVQGGLLHGGPVYQPVSQHGQTDGLRDVLVDRSVCLVEAQTQI